MEKIIKELYGEKYLEQKDLVEIKIKNTLSERELSILKLKFNEGLTLDNISNIYNLTKQRVSKIVKNSIHKITLSSFKYELNNILNIQNGSYPNTENKHINLLGLSNRAYNALIKNGIQTVNELLDNLDNLKNMKGIWNESLTNIKDTLYEQGYIPLPGNIYDDIMVIIKKYSISIDNLIEGLQNVKTLQKQ